MKYGPFDSEFEDPPKQKRSKKKLKSEIELVEEESQELIRTRYLEHEQLCPLYPTNEFPAKNWLASSLKPEERISLDQLIRAIYLKGEFAKYNLSYMLLAVGSTTFPARTWLNLKKFLELHDRKKLRYWKNHGEDIDLLFIPEDAYRTRLRRETTHAQNEQTKRVADILRLAKIDFEIETGRKDGKLYLPVPQKERIRHRGQRVIRINRLKYEGDYLIIYMQGSRPIHVGFDFANFYGDLRLKSERAEGYPFSLLFRNNDYCSLLNLIKHTNAQRELFSRNQFLGI